MNADKNGCGMDADIGYEHKCMNMRSRV